MPSLKERVQTRVDEVRQRRPFVDHVVRMIQHYSRVKGGQQSGAVTYFGFLSVFPILALAFAVVGFIGRAREEVDFQTELVKAIDSVLPGLVSSTPRDDKLYIGDIQSAAPGILSITLPILLYSGLGWLSAMRDALLVIFETPRREQPNFVKGKLRDLISLVTIGFTLIVAVAVAGLVTRFSEDILGYVQLADSLAATAILWVLTVLIGIGANSVLFFALFKLLASPDLPNSSIWSGALLGAVGFEVLKQASTFLLAATESSPATQAFGIALILLVWIHYFSQLVLYAAAWSYTSETARDFLALGHERQTSRDAQAGSLDGEPSPSSPLGAGSRRTPDEALQPGAAFALGGAAMLGAVALARKTIRKGSG
jgi:membrane protein